MEKLLRTKVSIFLLEDALKLSEIDALAKDGQVEEKILSVDELFFEYPKMWTSPKYDVVVHNGNRIQRQMFSQEKKQRNQGDAHDSVERLRVYDSENVFIGIYEYSEERRDYKSVKMFYESEK